MNTGIVQPGPRGRGTGSGFLRQSPYAARTICYFVESPRSKIFGTSNFGNLPRSKNTRDRRTFRHQLDNTLWVG